MNGEQERNFTRTAYAQISYINDVYLGIYKGSLSRMTFHLR